MAIWPLLTLLCVCHVSSTVTPHPGLVRRPSLVPREAQDKTHSFGVLPATFDGLISGVWAIDDDANNEDHGDSALPPTQMGFDASVSSGSVLALLRTSTAANDTVADLVAVGGVFRLRETHYAASKHIRYHMGGYYNRRSGDLVLLGAREGTPLELLSLIPNATHSSSASPTAHTVNALVSREAHALLKQRTASLRDQWRRSRLSQAQLEQEDESILARILKWELRQSESFQTRSFLYCKGRVLPQGKRTSPYREKPLEIQLKMSFGSHSGHSIQTSLISLDNPKNTEKTQKITYLSVGISLAQLSALFLLTRHANQFFSSASLSRFSLASIAINSLLSAYQSFALLFCVALFPSAHLSLSIAGFLSLTESLMEIRFFILIWRVRRNTTENATEISMRRQLSNLYLRYYVLLILGLLLIQQAGTVHLPVLLPFLSLSLAPQIVHSVHTNQALSVRSVRFLLVSHFSRLFLFLYFLSCPENPLSVPSLSLSSLLLFFFSLQSLIILSQSHFGARFFIPALLLPKQYKYDRVPTASDPQSIDCVICLCPIGPTPFMVTPCDHLFHKECLLEWMKVKMDCPSCRRALPPVEQTHFERHGDFV